MTKEPEQPTPPKVLIVDGDADARTSCVQALERAKFTVQGVGSMDQAVSELKGESWDLVVLDMQSSDVDGEELYDRIRNELAPEVGLVLSGDTDQTEDPYLERREQILPRPLVPELLVRVSAELKERRRVYELVSTTDPVTGALSHRGIRERLSDEIVRAERSCHPVSVALLDIDEFQELNDEHGHRTGDHVLSELVWLFKARMRRSDHIGRFGGGRFLALFPETKVEGAKLAVDKRREEFSLLDFQGQSTQFRTTYSAGVAAYPDDGEQPDDLIGSARKALKHAKTEGGNRVKVLHPIE